MTLHGAVRRVMCGLTVLSAAAVVAGGLQLACAQSARRGKPGVAETIDRTIAFPEAQSRCSSDYHGALKGLMADETRQPLATMKRIHSAMPGLKGYWLFQDNGERRRQRDAQNRLIDGERVCEEEQNRAGRTKCLRWETRAPEPLREPQVPTPPMTRDEARLMKQVTEFVQNRGAPPEFLSNGKYTIMSDRVAADLESYLAQDAHPALCTGAEEFLEFLEDQLPLLRKRASDVAELPSQARLLVAERIALLKSAISPPPSAVAANVTSAAGSAVTIDVVPKVGPVSSALAAAADIASLTLSPKEASAVSAEADALPALARAAAALSSETGSPLAAAQRAEARAAFRIVELAAYAELLAKRYEDLEAGLFGKIAAARKAHAASCTCDN